MSSSTRTKPIVPGLLGAFADEAEGIKYEELGGWLTSSDILTIGTTGRGIVLYERKRR